MAKSWHDGACDSFVNLSKTTQSHPLEHLGYIPCLGIRFVAYLDVLAGVIGKSLKA